MILTDYFFTIIDLVTASFGNESLFTQHKEKFPLIKCFGPMYIDFMSILDIAVEILNFKKKLLMKIFSVSMGMHILQVNRKCANGLTRNFGK